MPTSTTNYALQKPLVNNATDQDLWGGYLNDDLDDVDTLLRVGITIATQASQTSNFSADASISVKKLYPCDATSGAITVTIPAAATAGNGATVFIKKTDSSSNAVTPTRSGSDTLDGSTSLSMTGQNDVYGLVSNGVDRWNVIVEPVNVADASTTTKGIIEIATDAEFFAGSATDKAIVPSNFVIDPTADGYLRIGRLILQWGETSSFSVSTTVTFPIAFPTGCLQAYCGTATAATAVTNNPAATNLSTTSFVVRSGTTASIAYRWFAVGY